MRQKIENRKSKIENAINPAFPSEEFTSPAALGYAMPAEWERHEGTWIAWPHNEEDWPGKFAPIPWIYTEIVRLIAQGERVRIFVPPTKKSAAGIQDILQRNHANLKNVTLHPQATNRVWTRDSGPIFLTKRRNGEPAKGRNGEPANRRILGIADSPIRPISDSIPPRALVDFKFNAWAKYDDSALDDALPGLVAKHLRVPRFIAYGLNDHGEYQRFVLEGGSIDVNGAGCLLTTEECLLSKIQQRNPNFSRERIEETLCSYLGVSKILWLDKGIAGDDTHGHIDDTARFVDAGTIATCVESDASDANFAPMRENLRRLKKMRDVEGKQFTVVELPLPSAVYFDKQRLPASYANFYIANVGVLAPVFNDKNDGKALKIIEQCFPGRAVIPVYCRDLVWGLGTLHCMTQQQPG